MGCADHNQTMERLSQLGQMASHLSGQFDSLKNELRKTIPRPINEYVTVNGTTIDGRQLGAQATTDVVLIHRVMTDLSNPGTLTISGMNGPITFNVGPGLQEITFSDSPGSGWIYRSTDTYLLTQSPSGTMQIIIIGEILPDSNLW